MDHQLWSLPREIIESFLIFLDLVSLCNCSCSCKSFNVISESLWKHWCCERLQILQSTEVPAKKQRERAERLRKHYKWSQFFRRLHTFVLVCGDNITDEPVDWGITTQPPDKDRGFLGLPVASVKQVTAPRLLECFVGTNIKQIESGGYHTLVLDEDGRVWAYGSNAFGMLGTGDRTSLEEPKQVLGELKDVNIIKIAAGFALSAALDDNGTLYTWGFNKNGRLGIADNGPNTDFTEDHYPYVKLPTKVTTLCEHVIVDVAMGSGHSAVVTKEGKLFTFGRNDCGQLGKSCDSDDVPDQFLRDLPHSEGWEPRQVFDDSVKVKYIDCSGYSSACMTEDLCVYVWGSWGNMTLLQPCLLADAKNVPRPSELTGIRYLQYIGLLLHCQNYCTVVQEGGNMTQIHEWTTASGSHYHRVGVVNNGAYYPTHNPLLQGPSEEEMRRYAGVTGRQMERHALPHSLRCIEISCGTVFSTFMAVLPYKFGHIEPVRLAAPK